MLIRLKSAMGLIAFPTATASFQMPAFGAIAAPLDSDSATVSVPPAGTLSADSGAPAGLISARSFPLAPRSSPESALSDASVRYAAVGPSGLVRAAAPLDVAVGAALPGSREPAVAMVHAHPMASSTTSAPPPMSRIRSVRGETPARCQRLVGESGRRNAP